MCVWAARHRGAGEWLASKGRGLATRGGSDWIHSARVDWPTANGDLSLGVGKSPFVIN